MEVGAFGTHMEEKSLVVKPQAKIHSEDLGVDGSVILKWILNNRNGGDVEWIHLALYIGQYTRQIITRFRRTIKDSGIPEKILTSQVGCCSRLTQRKVV